MDLLGIASGYLLAATRFALPPTESTTCMWLENISDHKDRIHGLVADEHL
jgi:hypothetical protein